MEATFGPFVFDDATRQLRRGRELVHLSPKAFELLAILVSRRPLAVSKADLHLHLWPDTFVSDSSLAVLVAELRKALGDSAEQPTYIRTVPRFGYAFLVEPAAEASAGGADGQLPSGDGGGPSFFGNAERPPVRWSARASIAGALVLAVSFLFVAAWNYRGTADRRPPVRSVAILPLTDLSEPWQAYFSDGLTEELITRVAAAQQLRVVPRSAVMRYRHRDGDLSGVARELGVDAIVDGTVLRNGDRVRISVQLIDPRTNTTLWAESYERPLSNVLELHANLAVAIAAQLRVTLTPGEEGRMSRASHSVDPIAYDHYLRGLAHFERVNRADAEAAVDALQRAVEVAPSFADALGALALAYSQLYGSYAPSEAAALEPKAQASIHRALSIDPESADALLARGSLIWDGAHGWPHEESARTYQAALAQKPNLEPARRSLAVVYNHVGLADAALATLAGATETPAVLFQKGLAMRLNGHVEAGLTHWLAIPLSSRNANHVGHIAWALTDLERIDEAGDVLQHAASSGMEDVNGMLAAANALLCARRGTRLAATRWLAAATARAAETKESHHATYLAALTYARLDNRPESLRWLRFTAANGYPAYPLLASDVNLNPLRSYPPFEEFLADSKTRWHEYRSRLLHE